MQKVDTNSNSLSYHGTQIITTSAVLSTLLGKPSYKDYGLLIWDCITFTGKNVMIYINYDPFIFTLYSNEDTYFRIGGLNKSDTEIAASELLEQIADM